MAYTIDLEKLKNTRLNICPCKIMSKGLDMHCPCMDFCDTGKCICGVFKEVQE